MQARNPTIIWCDTVTSTVMSCLTGQALIDSIPRLQGMGYRQFFMETVDGYVGQEKRTLSDMARAIKESRAEEVLQSLRPFESILSCGLENNTTTKQVEEMYERLQYYFLESVYGPGQYPRLNDVIYAEYKKQTPRLIQYCLSPVVAFLGYLYRYVNDRAARQTLEWLHSQKATLQWLKDQLQSINAPSARFEDGGVGSDTALQKLQRTIDVLNEFISKLPDDCPAPDFKSMLSMIVLRMQSYYLKQQMVVSLNDSDMTVKSIDHRCMIPVYNEEIEDEAEFKETIFNHERITLLANTYLAMSEGVVGCNELVIIPDIQRKMLESVSSDEAKKRFIFVSVVSENEASQLDHSELEFPVGMLFIKADGKSKDEIMHEILRQVAEKKQQLNQGTAAGLQANSVFTATSATVAGAQQANSIEQRRCM